MNTANGKRVGYILKMFPRLSETFVLNEILELQRQQVEVHPFSLRAPEDGRFHAGLAGLGTAVEYVGNSKLEPLWSRLNRLPADQRLHEEGWTRAVDFLRRHEQPKELETLLRACWIAACARRAGVQHLHAHFATIAARVACLVHLLTGLPFSFTAHAKDIFRDDVDVALFTEMATRAAFVVTVSDFNRSFILRRFEDVPADKVVRLYNGIDLDQFHLAGNGGGGGVPHILSVGRLVPKKGFDRLLSALARCRDEHGMQFEVTIVGEGPEWESLLAQRDALGLAGRVRFTGALPHDEVRAIGERASVMALAALRDDTGNMDALPTVLLEALAQGVPIVSTRVAGIPEIVGEQCGLLVEPGDEVQLAGALRDAVRQCAAGAFDPQRLRKRAERLFDLRSNVARLRGHMFGSVPRASAA